MIANRHLKTDNCVTLALMICLSASGEALDVIPLFAAFSIIINAFIRFGRTDRDGTPTARVNEAQHNAVVEITSPVSVDIFSISEVCLLQSNKIREQLRSESRK